MKLRNSVMISLAFAFIAVCFLAPSNAVAQRRHASESRRPVQRGQHEEHYHESELRRFEIVTLVSLPFTAIHSFLAVRGIEMIRQSEISPELTNADFKIIGASAVSFALFIGFWDWLHTRGKDPSEPLIPASPSTPSPKQPRRKVGNASWNVEETSSFKFPLVQIRF